MLPEVLRVLLGRVLSGVDDLTPKWSRPEHAIGRQKISRSSRIFGANRNKKSRTRRGGHLVRWPS